MTSPIQPGEPCPRCRRPTAADDHFAMCHPCMTAWYTPQPGEPVYYGDGFGGHDTSVPTIRIRATTEARGFFAGLTPEQQKAALEYRGPEDHSDPAFLRRRD